MGTHKPNGRLIRRALVSTLVAGVALAFVLFQRDPGWQPFVAAGLLALASMLLTVAMLPGSDPVGYLALVVLLLGMLWEPGRPWSAVVGVVLVFLNALKNARVERIEAESPAVAELPEPGGPVG
jgi:hypothetical protein